MTCARPSSKTRRVLYDLTRIGEWWTITVVLVLFAFIPWVYRSHGETISTRILSDLATSPSLYAALLVVFCAQMFLFAGNDYFDRKVDCLDEKKKRRNPVCNGSISTAQVYGVLVATAAISLLAALYFDLVTFVFTAATLLIFLFYTAEPLRFKNKAVLDVLSHGIFINTFPFFFCLVALRDFYIEALYLLGLLMLRSAIAQMLQEVRDFEVDRKVERNTVVILGRQRSIPVVFAMFMTITVTTGVLMLSHWLFSWGITLFFLLVLFICVVNFPYFWRLLRTEEEGTGPIIESMWMGQGRTNRWQIGGYTGSFSTYMVILYFFLL